MFKEMCNEENGIAERKFDKQERRGRRNYYKWIQVRVFITRK